MDSAKQDRRRLDGFAIKRIAVISMVIDHFGSFIIRAIINPYRVNGAFFLTDEMPFLVRHAFQIKDICEILGSVGLAVIRN